MIIKIITYIFWRVDIILEINRIVRIFRSVERIWKLKTPLQATGHQICSAAEQRGI